MPQPDVGARSVQALPWVLVLASGRGSRFLASGGQGSKLQALLAGVPVLERTLQAVRASGLPWHLETGPHNGMGDSIAAAVRATRTAPGWLVLPGDLPLIRPQTLRQLAQAPLDRGALRPSYQGQPGHPVRFAASFGAALAGLRGPSGAAGLLAPGDCRDVPVDDPGCVLDIDTLADLQRAQGLWQSMAAAPAGDRPGD